MKKTLFLIFICVLTFGASAQYQRIAKQGRMWYSLEGQLHSSHATDILTIESDTLINGITYPLLVRKDSSLNAVKKLAYCDEDTMAGTLRIDFFNSTTDEYFDYGCKCWRFCYI